MSALAHSPAILRQPQRKTTNTEFAAILAILLIAALMLVAHDREMSDIAAAFAPLLSP